MTQLSHIVFVKFSKVLQVKLILILVSFKSAYFKSKF